MSVKKPGRMSANIKINTDINLLEINLGYSHIPKEETDAFFNAVKLKKKYYRLKDGTCHCTLGTSTQSTLLIIKALQKHLVPNKTIYYTLGTTQFHKKL